MGVVTSNMLLIKVNEGAENEYPLRMGDMSRCLPDTWLPLEPDADLLKEFGVYVVETVDKPEGEVVTEGVPVLLEGTWRQTWIVRDNTPEEAQAILEVAKAKALYRIEQWRVTQFAKGFPFLAPDGEIYHIQVSDAARVNILGRRTQAKEALGTDTVFTFRSYENISITMTPEEMVEMADQSVTQIDLGFELVWGLKDQTRDATTVAEIPAIPAEMFEPL